MHRANNCKSPSIYALMMNLVGIGVIGPFYAAASSLRDCGAIYTTASRRAVPVTLAKWILPSILIGYGVPTLLIFRTDLNPEHHQILIVAWQFAAIPVSLLLMSFAWIERSLIPSAKRSQTQPIQSRDADAVYLERAYQAVFVLNLIVHLATVYWITFSSNELVTISRLLDPTNDAVEPRPDTIASFMFTTLRWDHLFAIIAFWFYGCVTIFTMRGTGIITNLGSFKALATFSAAHVATGPGAALMGLWLWRERTMRLPVQGRP